MLELFLQPETWAIFATLFALEIILGVDNIVFISVLCERLPVQQRKLARNLGISLAVLARIILVFSISWVMSLTQPLLEVQDFSLTGRDLIMIAGGGFLLAKSAKELWSWLMYSEQPHSTHMRTGMAVVLLQIIAVDAVFSMDSVITAIGLTSEVPIMVAAILASALVMILIAEKINNLVIQYPGFKTFAMLFGLILELCHIQLKKKQHREIQMKTHSSKMKMMSTSQ